MIFTRDTDGLPRMAIDTDDWSLTIGGVRFENGSTFRPGAGCTTDEQRAAVLLDFYSHYASYAASDEHTLSMRDAEFGPDYFTAEQWAALDAIGEDEFTMWAEDLAPTCAEGCGAWATYRAPDCTPYCERHGQ